MEVATRRPMMSPTRGIAASKKPKDEGGPKAEPSAAAGEADAAAKFDKPNATAISKIPDTEPN